MTTTKNYDYGNGGYAFSEAEVKQLDELFQDISANVRAAPGSVAPGAAGDIYRTILDDISTTTYEPSVPQTVTKPKPGVDLAVYNWIAAAGGINGGTSAAGDLVAGYTYDISTIRGESKTPNQLYLASARIGLALANGIIKTGLLPDIIGLGAADAGSTASTLFDGIYSPWAGTALFSFFKAPSAPNGAPFYADWLLTADDVTGTAPNYSDGKAGPDTFTFKQYTGTYELISALQAYKQISPLTLLGTLFTGTAAGDQADPSPLVGKTQNFFWTYYGLTSTEFPTLGFGAPFDSTTRGEPVYHAGTVAGETITVGVRDQVVAGGPNDDTVAVSQLLQPPLIPGTGSRLLDGGSGSNTLAYTRKDDIMVKLQKVQRSASAEDPTYTGAPKTVLKVLTSTSNVLADYAYNFQTVNLGPGKNTFSVGAGITKNDLLNKNGTPVLKSLDGGSRGENTLDLRDFGGSLTVDLDKPANNAMASYTTNIRGLVGDGVFSPTNFQIFKLGSGDDTIQIDPNLNITTPLMVDGGGGNNMIHAGVGSTTTYYGGSYGTNVLYGAATFDEKTLSKLVGGPSADDIQYHVDNPDLPSLGDPGASNATIYSGLSSAVMVGGPGKNTFNIQGVNRLFDNPSDPIVNVAWGNGGVSTYNIIGRERITILYIDDASVDKIIKLTPDEMRSYIGGNGEWGETVIINPGPDDRITLNGAPVSSPSYQQAGRSDIYAATFSTDQGYYHIGGNINPASGQTPESLYGPIGTSTAYGVVSAYTYVGHVDGFNYTDGNPNGQGAYYFKPQQRSFANNLLVYGSDLSKTPGVVSPNASILQVDNFVNGDFGVKAIGNGPGSISYLEPAYSSFFGPSKLLQSTPDLTSPAFLSYSEKKHLSVNEAQGDNSTVHSGSGNSVLIGNARNPNYAIDVGAATVTINNEHDGNSSGGTGTISFDSSVQSADIAVSGDGSNTQNLVIKDAATGLKINVLNAMSNPSDRIAAVNFSDGATLSYSQLITIATTGSSTQRDLYGDSDGNVLDSKGYAYYAWGGGGGDTFVYNAGYGDLYIDELDTGSTPDNVLAFGAGIEPTSVTVSGDSFGDLTLALDDGSSIDIGSALSNGTGASYGVQHVTFANGTTWTYNDLISLSTTGSSTNTRLYGDAGGNVLDSKGFATYAQGNGGADIFVFNPGYGQLEVDETDASAVLRLGAGITAAQVQVTRDIRGNIYLTDGVAGDQVKLNGMINASVLAVQQVQFSDGTAWTHSQVTALAGMGTAGSDVIAGTSGNDLLDGRGGGDTVSGGGGSDIYFMRQGYGVLTIDNSTPSSTATQGEVDFGPGITEQNLWFSRSGDALLARVLGSADAVDVKGWFGSNPSAQLAGFKAFDGLKLDGQLGQLASAMAAYAGSNPGFDPTTATMMPTDPVLRSALGTAWHS